MQSLLQYRALRKQLLSENRQNAENVAPGTRQPVQTRNWHDQPEAAAREATPGNVNINTHQSLQLSTHTLHSDLQPAADVERADWRLDLGVEVSRTTTQQADDNRPSITVTGVHAEDDKPENEKPFVVSFERKDDLNDPHNWGLCYRALCTAYMSFMAASVEFFAVADSAPIEEAVSGQHKDRTVRFMLIAMYLVFLGIGCLFTAPLSEILGRNPVYVVSLFVLTLMVMTTHVINGRAYRVITRSIGALFGSGTTMASAGAISDIWPRLDRSYIFAIYVCVVFAGPLLATIVEPIIIGLYDVTAFPAQITFTSLACLIAVFLMPETYTPVILYWKAKQLRKLTGQSTFSSPIELRRVTFKRRMKHALTRPFRFLYKDRMLAFLVAYTSLIYIITYQMFSAVPLVFVVEYHFSLVHEGLAFIPTVGGLFLCAPAVFWNYRILKKRLIIAQGHAEVEPEIGLFLAMAGAPAIPISLFWMAWTGNHSIPFWVPLFSTSLYSYGVVCVIISVFQYATDSFESYAASAQAGVLMARYVFAGIIAQFSVIIHQKLQVKGALSLFGGLSVLMVPVPFLLYRYAYRFQKSKYRTQKHITED